MKYFVGPITTRARDKRVNKIIKQGGETHDELFEAQYGEWSVRGLDKDTPRDEMVHIKGFLKDQNYKPWNHLFRLGYAKSSEKGDNEIYLNGLALSPLSPILGLFATRLAYARAYDVFKLALPASTAPIAGPLILAMVAMSSYRYAVASSLTKLFALSTADIIGEEQIHTFHTRNPAGSIASSAFRGVAQDWLGNQEGWKKTKIETSQFIDMILTLMPRGYYAADAELQARLHNLMVRGYPAWGKIPEDTDELYAALMDMGIKTPNRIKDYYSASENRHLTCDFNHHSGIKEGYFSPPISEMNIGLNSYRDGKLLGFKTGEILDMYWEDCLPHLYADLHVKYGDSNGLKKFGFSSELDMAGMPIRLNPQFK